MTLRVNFTTDGEVGEFSDEFSIEFDVDFRRRSAVIDMPAGYFLAPDLDPPSHAHALEITWES